MATVTQDGDNNSSDIDQIGAFSSGSTGSVATVTQSGTNGESYILQDSTGLTGFPSRVTVTQTGDGGESIVRQTGSRNTSVRVNQDGANFSYVDQSGVTLDSGAAVRQSGGDGNTAIVFMQQNNARVGNSSNGNDGVTQVGNFNNSEVYQLAGGRSAQARSDQNGDRNDSVIIQAQIDNNDSIRAQVDQDGNDNISSLVQTGRNGSPNAAFENQMANIIQSGNDNLSRVEQDIDLIGASTSSLQVIQNNDGNDSFIRQDSGGGLIDIVQTSTDTSGSVVGTDRLNTFDSTAMTPVFDSVRANFSRVVQDGLGITQATLRQTGFGNRSDIRQTTNNTLPVHRAFVTQEGERQNSDVSQTFGGDIATVNQGVGAIGSADNSSIVEQFAGLNNVAFVDQIGSFNESQIDQSGGNANDANVDQDGLRGFSGISQTGGNTNDANLIQSASSEDSISLIFQDGMSNVATVTQNGVGDFSTIDQTGTGNSATVTQGTP